MKEIINFIFTFTLLFFISGCVGYEPIFSSSNLEFRIANHTLEGNKILGNKIYSKLYSLSKSKKNNQDVKNIDLLINVSKNKRPSSKDSAGKTLEYKITLKTKVEVIDLITKDRILDKIFISSLTYKVQKQYSDTLNLENKSIENLINKTYQDLLIVLSKNITNK